MGHADNYALYNAPAGTAQRMAVYYYLNARDDRATHDSVLAYTHNDVFKPVPGYKVMTGHFHMDFNELLRDRNTLDYQPPWIAVFRALGVNVLYLADFHDDSHPSDPGPVRFKEQKVYFEGSRAGLRQRLFGDSGRRAGCLHRRPLVPDEPEAGVLHPHLSPWRRGRREQRQ